MRLKIDISTVKFRVAGVARPRQVSKNDKTQKRTPPSDGGRLIWTVRLLAVDTQANTTEQIFVEVAGDMPQLAVDEIATVQGLTYAPWASVKFTDGKPKAEIMRAFRADSIAMADVPSRRAA
jgi:hypothetical protein